jgi:hypothetical protein
MRDFSVIKKETLARSNRLGRDTARVIVTDNKKVSVSVQTQQKSISQVVEAKKLLLTKINNDIDNALLNAKDAGSQIVEKAVHEARKVIETVTLLESKTKSELLQAELLKKQTEESLLKAKIAQKQTESDSVALQHSVNVVKSEQETLAVIKSGYAERLQSVKELLETLSVLVEVTVGKVKPILESLDLGESKLAQSLEKVNQCAAVIENKLSEIEYREKTNKETSIQLDTEKAIIVDKRQQLSRVAFELNKKQHGK